MTLDDVKNSSLSSDVKKSNRKVSFIRFIKIWNDLQQWNVPDIHKEMAKWLSNLYNSKNKKGLLLAFRGSGKSSIAGLFAAWVLYKQNDCRVLIVSADERLAKKMSANVKKIISKHPLMQELKPKKGDWATNSFTISRNKELRDPSVMAIGISGNITGSRADVIICDDVEVPKNCNTFLKRELLREKLNELEFVITPNGLILYLGTPHTLKTIYKTN